MTKSPPPFHRLTIPHAAGRRTRLLAVALVLIGLALAAWVVRRVSRAAPGSPEALLQKARGAWSSGRLDEAEAALAALSEMGRSVSVPERLLRAQVAKERGRIDQALAELEGVPDSDPDAASIWQARGLLELERNRAGPAEASLLHALAKDPKLAAARRGLVDLYTIEGRKKDLGDQLSALATISSLTFDDLYLWCLGRRQDVGPAEIAAKLEQLLQNEPDDRTIRLALAENDRRLGRLVDAETALAPLSAADPDARAARARLAIDRGAVELADRLLAEGPADHPALTRLRGRLALGRGDASAVGQFRRALALEPDDREALFGLGQSLRLAGQAKEAEPHLEAARARDHLEWLIQNARSSLERDDPKVLRTLGESCAALGHLHEARGWLRLALARDPLASDLQKRLFELDKELAGNSVENGRSKPRN